MSLSYHFTLTAPLTASAAELLKFLKSVEGYAQSMGFHPTMVLDATFDSPERREFARSVMRGVHIEDERLKGVVLPDERQVWDFSPTLGHCRIAPERAVILIVTDEQGCETVFGFARYPETLRDINGRAILKTPVGDRWYFRDFVDSADERFRKIVKRFADAGYVEVERDAFGKVVFPNADDAPTKFAKFTIHAAVAGLVGGEFGFPESAIVGRCVAMLEAAVPETAVNENGNSGLTKYKVRLSEHGLITAPTDDAMPPQEDHQGEFRVFVATPANPGHDIGSLRFGEDVSHYQAAKWSVSRCGGMEFAVRLEQ